MAEIIFLYILFVICKTEYIYIYSIFTFNLIFFLSDLSENQIQAIPRKAFRGAVDIKNL